MPEGFKDKTGNFLKKGVLYEIPPFLWPFSFQDYEYHPEGDSKKLEAVFWDFTGNPHNFNEKRINLSAVPLSHENAQRYINTAKSLVEWLISYYKQTSPSCTEELRGYASYEDKMDKKP